MVFWTYVLNLNKGNFNCFEHSSWADSYAETNGGPQLQNEFYKSKNPPAPTDIDMELLKANKCRHQHYKRACQTWWVNSHLYQHVYGMLGSCKSKCDLDIKADSSSSCFGKIGGLLQDDTWNATEHPWKYNQN